MFNLNMTNAKPMNLILTSAETAYCVYHLNDGVGVNIYVSNASLFFCVNIQAVFTPSIFLGAGGVDVTRTQVVKGK